jgi:hypothetical protein
VSQNTYTIAGIKRQTDGVNALDNALANATTPRQE